MKGDFTRFTFDPKKHYSGVFKQQGRVDLDADWNEYVEMQEHIDRVRTRDIIGLCGVPISGKDGNESGGFNISDYGSDDLKISPGNIYVDGILCQLDEGSIIPIAVHKTNDNQIIVPSCTIDGMQFDIGQRVEIWEKNQTAAKGSVLRSQVIDVDPVQNILTLSASLASLRDKNAVLQRIITYLSQPDYPGCPDLNQSATCLVYLDVWKHHITAIDDPNIRETALGGPDTTTRIKTVWQVKVAKVGSDVKECAEVPTWDQLPPTKPSQGRLTTSLNPSGDTTNPCALSEEGGYSGLENRLYRVEIHDSGDPAALSEPMSPAVPIIPYPVEKINGVSELTLNPEVWAAEAWQPGQLVEISSERPDSISKSNLFHILNVDDASCVLTLDADISDLASDKNITIKRVVATFKWSRDNGSVVFPIEKFQDKNKIKLKRLGRDQVLTLHDGDWVEVLDDVSELSGEPGTMAKIIGDPDQAGFTLSLSKDISKYQEKYPAKIRRWDQKSDVINVTTGGTIDLEAGIRIQFSGSNFKTGDYWVFAARTTGEIETLTNAPPRGIKHHYCKLALVTMGMPMPTFLLAQAPEEISTPGPLAEPIPPDKIAPIEPPQFSIAVLADCRQKFKPLTELGSSASSCCTVTVGDGITSFGDYNDIQTAINDLIGPDRTKPGEGPDHRMPGGRVCILPGIHTLKKTVLVQIPIGDYSLSDFSKSTPLVISGCGLRTRIIGPDKGPAFSLNKCNFVDLESLYIENSPGEGCMGLEVMDSNYIRISDCFIMIKKASNNPEIQITNCSLLSVLNCHGQVVIKGNFLYAKDVDPATWSNISIMGHYVTLIKNRLIGTGIWIQNGSYEITVQDNFIDGTAKGKGPGIALGGRMDSSKGPDVKFVQYVNILGNTISHAINSGISTFSKEDYIYSDITISCNKITECAREGPDSSFDPDVVGGIVLRNIAGVRIFQNHLSDNGSGAACGIFTFGCQDLDISVNTIINNGSASEPNPTCINFENLTPSEPDTPYTIQGVRFTAQDSDGQDPKKIHLNQGLVCEQMTQIEFIKDPVQSVTLDFVPGEANQSIILEGYDESSRPVARAEYSWNDPHVTLAGYGPIKKAKLHLKSNMDALFSPKIKKLCYEDWDGMHQAGVAILDASSASNDERDSAVVHGNTVVCPKGPALILRGSGSMSVLNNTLTSLVDRIWPMAFVSGNLSFYSLPAACVSILAINSSSNPSPSWTAFVVNTKKHAEVDLEISGIVTSGIVPTDNCRILFNDNQVTQKSIERMLCSILIVADDISLQDNQTRIESVYGNFYYYVGYDAFLSANTIRASGNRFAECYDVAQGISYYSIGSSLNLATDNQANYCMIIGGSNPIDDNNQSILCNKAKWAPEGKFKPDRLQAYLNDILGDALSASSLESTANLHKNRAASLSEKANKLEIEVGKGDPLVAKLRQMAPNEELLGQRLLKRAANESRRPSILPTDWVVYGRVHDQKGDPAKGLAVKISDPDRKYLERLGKAVTDERGEFTFIFHEQNMAGLSKELSDLNLIIEDSSGKLIYTSKDKISYSAGSAEYFEIGLRGE